MKPLLFGRLPEPEEAPGKRTEFPINWGRLRFGAAFVSILWIGLSLYAFFKPGLPVPRRWLLVLIVTGMALLLMSNVIRQYRRAVHVVFTSEGIWAPTLDGGQFLPWAQVTRTRLRNARDIELDYPRPIPDLGRRIRRSLRREPVRSLLRRRVRRYRVADVRRDLAGPPLVACGKRHVRQYASRSRAARSICSSEGRKNSSSGGE